MRNLVLFATAGVAATALIGAILPVPRDGLGHPITEYAGVFQSPHSPMMFLSVIYFDGQIYAAERDTSSGSRSCLVAGPWPRSGMKFVPRWPDADDTHQNMPGKTVLSAVPIRGSCGMCESRGMLLFASHVNGLMESDVFWPRVADSANVWDMYAYDAHGQPKFCVPDGLVTPGSHSFSQGSPPAVINHPVAAPTRGP